jgi:hypothetical protein
MTRAEVLAQYRPIRAGIRRVLREAAKACSRADLNRAIKQVAPWAEAAELEEADTAEMLVDVALFEPNQRGRRAFDRFLAEAGEVSSPRQASPWPPLTAPWPSAWPGRGSPSSAWPGGMRQLGSGWRTCWRVTAASGSWMRRSRRPPRRVPSPACACRRGAVPRRLRHHRRARRRDARLLPGGERARRALAVPPLARRDALRRPTPGRGTARTRRPRFAADPGRDPHLPAQHACESRAEAARPPITKAAQGIKARQEVIGIGP